MTYLIQVLRVASQLGYGVLLRTSFLEAECEGEDKER